MGDVTPLNKLLQQTGLWRASSIDCEYKKSSSSGFAQLDRQLPGGGWPSDGVTEILHTQYGIGEFRLLAPALARLSHEESRWLLLVNPPYIPYPPALAQAGVDLTSVLITQPRTTKDYLWVLEKALASQSCSAVISWPGNIHMKQLRRLQVASKEGNCWNILFRHEKAIHTASPAELRIRIRPAQFSPLHESSAIDIKILKRRGGWESDTVRIHFEDDLNRITPDFSELIIRKRITPKPDIVPYIETPSSGFNSSYEYQ